MAWKGCLSRRSMTILYNFVPFESPDTHTYTVYTRSVQPAISLWVPGRLPQQSLFSIDQSTGAPSVSRGSLSPDDGANQTLLPLSFCQDESQTMLIRPQRRLHSCLMRS
ncbi:hypothetical protein ElyMa_001715800 [Elysia marginata]|uniref:Uncharacterized protein n=1 Tax=Elysia marginata TaxID=1093978 RepID=A0AAV4JVR0_9GAST|nr:hypothetical protein ElyMa_001715800 [Elysia marginata]